MASEPRTSALHLLHRLCDEGILAGLSDAQLVERFATGRNHDAFAALVARHGPMVMAVCRGIIGPSGDDDAFQATFLVLLKRIGTFPVGQSLGGWLYQVALRVARQARVSDVRRRRRESAAEPRVGSAAERDPERSEILDLIRQEVDRLPERYRATIVLCDLQGLSRDEAAALLGCPAGTVGGRLARARRQLRDRLDRRGVAPLVVFPPPPEFAVGAGAWRISLEAAIRTSTALAVGNSATPAAISLAVRSTKAVAVASVKTAIALTIAACLAVGLVANRRAAGPPELPPYQPPAATNPPSVPPEVPVGDPDDPKLAGRFVGRVTGPDGRPLAGARLFIVPDSSAAVTLGPVRTLSGADGRFEFDAPDMTYPAPDGLPARRPGLLVALAEGYAPDGVITWGQTGASFHSHLDPVKGADLTLRLVRDDVPIRGRLLDPQGRPLADARVRLTTLLVPWKHDLDAHLKKYSLSANEVWMFDYEWSLHRPQLLPGVDVETITDGDGRFKISGLGRDRLADLTVSAPSVVQTDLRVMTRDAPDIVLDRDSEGNPRRATLGANFTFRLMAGRSVSGIVRDRETHQPIPGMLVGHHVLDSLKQQNGYPPAVTGPTGRFTVTGIHPAIVPLELQAVSQPGMPYVMAQGVVDGQSDLVIECARGIPFRLKVVDDSGVAVDASVEYLPVLPNPYLDGLIQVASYYGHSLSVGARRGKGLYEGFVIPGPGAVLVKTAGPTDYRPADVDPKAFFAPGKTNWTEQELTTGVTPFGNQDILIIGPGYAATAQIDYAAILLVNPPLASKPLELKATLVRDKPREVTLVDPEGRPVVGVQSEGVTPQAWVAFLRTSTFPLKQLQTDRSRRITFIKEDRKLIGFLLARGDGETPYIVRMQPWAAVTGRILDENARPLTAVGTSARQQIPPTLGMKTQRKLATRDDSVIGDLPAFKTGLDGRFRIERLVPGQRYSAEVYRGIGLSAVSAFENLVLQPGEVRDLGDIPTKAPIDIRNK